MGLHFQLEYANLCLAENSRSADPAAKNMNRGRRPAIRHKDMRRMSLQARALRGTHAAAGPENASGLQATKGRAGTPAQRATARRARLRNGIWQADARGKPARRRPAIRHKDMRRMSLRARALRGTHAAAGPENASGLQATKGRAWRAGQRTTARRARLRNGM